MRAAGFSTPDAVRVEAGRIVGRAIGSARDLSNAEVGAILDALAAADTSRA
jgi:hypothetical protein